MELVEAVECRERGGLPNVLAKLEAGQATRIAYVGGSLTEAPGWRVQTYESFQRQYPDAGMQMISAGIGGTGSDLGVYRLAKDVLSRDPDLMFVEFSVNDSGTDPQVVLRAMEGIVRRTWRTRPRCDICFVYTVVSGTIEDLKVGFCHRAATVHERVADHYGIPSVHMAMDVARLAREGKLVMAAEGEERERLEAEGVLVFTSDGAHPGAEGHRFYSEAVRRSWPRITSSGHPGDHPLPDPIAPDNWEGAQLVAPGEATLAGNWVRLPREKWPETAWNLGVFPELWRAAGAGTSVALRFRGTAFGIWDVVGPDSCQLLTCVDGRPGGRVSSRFDPYCAAYRVHSGLLATGLPEGEHTVTVSIHPDPPDKVAILARGNVAMDDPRRYEGLAFYPGFLMIAGDVIAPSG